ncbi:hypothetical protein CCP3SC1AL1_1180003 [Gammaproteobacteria bacterium]
MVRFRCPLCLDETGRPVCFTSKAGAAPATVGDEIGSPNSHCVLRGKAGVVGLA